MASVAYRYRKFRVSDDISMMVRCQLDGVLEAATEDDATAPEAQFMTSMALNEFDPRVTRVDWRRKLGSQHSAVLANELMVRAEKPVFHRLSLCFHCERLLSDRRFCLGRTTPTSSAGGRCGRCWPGPT